MNDDDLHRALVETEEIVPSSGFVASVMDAVREEATAPAPIPFPWKWALPGWMVSVALVVGLIVRWIASGGLQSGASHTAPGGDFFTALPQGWLEGSTKMALEWSVLALLVSLIAVRFSMRLAGGKE